MKSPVFFRPVLNPPYCAAIVLAAILLLVDQASACVGCREPGAETVAKESPTVMAGIAFSWSVLFMLCFVVLVVVGMSVYIGRTCCRIEREREGQ